MPLTNKAQPLIHRSAWKYEFSEVRRSKLGAEDGG